MTDPNVIAAAESQEDRLLRLTAEVSERRTAISQLDVAIAQRQAQLGAVSAELKARQDDAARHYIETHDRVKGEYEAKVADFNGHIEAKRIVLQELRDRIAAAKGELAELEAAIAAKHAELASVSE